MRVRIAGRWLHTFTKVGGLRVRHGADGGCLEASAAVSGSRSVLEHPLFRRGASVEVFDGLRRVWVGRLAETPEVSGEWLATGLLSEAGRFVAVDSIGVPTDDVDAALDQAVLDGLPFTYAGDAPANYVPNETPQTLDAAIVLHAQANSVRATVRGDGLLRWETTPTVPAYVVLPGVGALSRADEDFATRVTVRYVSSVSGTPPVADDFDYETAIDTAAEAIHGRSSLPVIDITSRGLLTATEAGYVAEGILNKYGARLAFTSSVTVSADQLRTPGLAKVGLGTVEAGRMVRFLGVRTPSHVGTTAFDIVIGATDYIDASGQITLSPLGLVPRDLVSVIASVPTVHTELNPAPGAGAVSAA